MKRHVYMLAMAAWLFFLGVTPLCHAVDFRTDRLEKIAKKTGLLPMLDTLTSGEHTSLTVYKGRPLTVIVSRGRIVHIGHALFSADQRAAFGQVVCNFLERYSLELAIPTHPHFSAQERMKNDDVSFLYGNMDLLPQITQDSTVVTHIQTLNERGYTVSWMRDTTMLCLVSFPIEYDILMGTDMDERERRLFHEVIRDSLSDDGDLLPQPSRPQLRKAWQDNYYTLPGNNYLLDNLTNSQYFMAVSTDCFVPIYSRVYPLESLANLFTTNLVDNDFTLRIRLRKYGFKTDTVSVPLRQWMRYCRHEGCTPFFGSISFEEKGKAICELIMHNKEMGYNHIMKLTFPMDIFDDRRGVIDARLNSYVTSSRIKKLLIE